MLAGSFLLYEFSQSQGLSVDQARTVTVNAFVAMEMGYLINCRVLDRSVLTVGLFSNRPLLLGVGLTVVLQVVFTYSAFFHAAFQTAAIPWPWWLAVAFLGIALMGIVGLEKRLTRG